MIVARILLFTFVLNFDLEVYFNSLTILELLTCEQKHNTNTAKAVDKPLGDVGHHSKSH